MSEYKPRVTRKREVRGDGLTAYEVETETVTFGSMTSDMTPAERRAMLQANHVAMVEWASENNAIYADTLGHLSQTIKSALDKILSAANWRYDDQKGKWVDAEGNSDDRPDVGLGWYCHEIDRCLASIRTAKSAPDPLKTSLPLKIFEAGGLLTEMSIRVAHNDYFMRRQANTESQRDAGRRARLKVKPEVAREAYRRHRNANRHMSKTEAARRAGKELGVSASTITRAFPNGLPD